MVKGYFRVLIPHEFCLCFPRLLAIQFGLFPKNDMFPLFIVRLPDHLATRLLESLKQSGLIAAVTWASSAGTGSQDFSA